MKGASTAYDSVTSSLGSRSAHTAETATSKRSYTSAEAHDLARAAAEKMLFKMKADFSKKMDQFIVAVEESRGGVPPGPYQEPSKVTASTRMVNE